MPTMTTALGIIEAERNKVLHPQTAHVAEGPKDREKDMHRV